MRLCKAAACAALLLLAWAGLASAADVYPNVEALKADKVAGKDYRIECVDRHSIFTSMTIHGGRIERGTSEVARAIAEPDWNLYLFEGLQRESPRQLHVTATHFDDPCALKLAGKSWLAVTAHGLSDHRVNAQRAATCVGGGNVELRRRTAEALRAAGFEVWEPCRIFPGNDNPRNIVNRARFEGVELEMTPMQRAALVRSSGLMKRFSGAVRSSFEAFAAGLKGAGGR